VVKVDVEPAVDLGVQRKVLVADLLRRQTLLQRLRLRRRAVLVRAADVQRLVLAWSRSRHTKHATSSINFHTSFPLRLKTALLKKTSILSTSIVRLTFF